MKRLLSALVLAPIILLVLWVGGMLFKIFIAVIMLMAFYEFFMMARFEKSIGWRILIPIIAGIYCFTAFYATVTLPLKVIIVLLLSVWASDIGAYFVGKTVGGPKLAPKLSPNKTISGLIGACLAPYIVLSLAFSSDATSALIFSTMIGFIGQIGDVSVSALKRRVGVKDTGNLIPGHGGILDRIDALILVIIVFWIGINTGILQWPNVQLAF